MAPVIGVTATLKHDAEKRDTRPLGTYVRADLDYVAGVAQAGGVPVVLPPFAEAAGEMVRGIDGLLLSGGSDLDPGYYGEDAIPELDVTIPQRDEFEMVLLRHALDRGIPVFGICRGLQVLNVAFGGTLYQDLPSQVNPALIAHRQLSPKWEWTHEVELDEGSATRGIMAVPSTRVNSYHHQAIKDLAEPFRAVGRSVDGIVEAIEHRDLSERWIVAVQWHAEAMREGDVGPEHRNLFRAHVAAAERHALKRAAAKGLPAASPRGPFVTVEGIDFSGKSTLVSLLREGLAGLDPPVHFTREPGGTAVAERIRALLLDPELDMGPWAEAYLYAAARAELVEREILPRLLGGGTVVCERFLDSSLAYQGYGRGLGAREVRDLNSWAVGTVVPDRTFYLRLPEEERARRARRSDAPLDRIERVGDEFMGRVEAGFEEISRSEPERVRVLDALLPPGELAGVVRREIEDLRLTRTGAQR